MTRDELINDYWRYYTLLEKKYSEALNFVQLNILNNATFSVEFTNQLLAIGSEIDVFFKKVCGFASTDNKNINDYAVTYISQHPNIMDEEVMVINRNYTTKPFDGWRSVTPHNTPLWWTAYNEVKHSRVDNFPKANLANVTSSLSALYLLIMQAFKDVANGINEPDIPDISSEVFSIKNWRVRWGTGRELNIEFDN